MYIFTYLKEFCSSIHNINVIFLSLCVVYFEALDVDRVGVTVFLSSLKLPWATALSINEAYMDMFQIQEIDNGK